ncbi:iron complex outermembrane recepter protein [Kaistella chaponensis]|uniref:Iron complex outermembrane recepter protein n=1 Tax=Kaistella chaponensis TaxID=713588 RepID=A0A1N7JRL3_9FLAO|nr:TonB-dependent receptor [Kaistella chaponensis]SIS51864.1 iron complex outermembrane recepter protein [Kaistella chaponensis]
MTKKYQFSAVFLLFYFLGFAQEEAIDTVYIFDSQLKNSKKFHKIENLDEADLLKNSTNLSEVLRFQSPVYIKENGRGMVSSPSFRGTSAQQTAFIWNGININSIFLGQGDINNLNLLGYDQLEIKSGGGSVIYGSGAIGGTVHLNNELSFKKGFKTSFFAEGGSYNTFNSFLKSSYSNDHLSVKVSGNFVKSDNDYDVPEKNYTNLNGEYDNRNFNLGAAYKINSKNTISWQTQIYNGVQHYPIFSESMTKTKYISDTFRSLVNWNFRTEKVQNIFRLAYLEDEFQYFSNINKAKSSGGTAKIYLAKNDFNYIFNEKLAFNFIGEYQLNKGQGFQSGISNVERNAGSIAGLVRWNASQKVNFEAGIKKDFVEAIETPVLYSFSGKVNVNNWYSLIFNASKNFRFPSFNDLYWQPGGNLDLKSETSLQADLGNRFQYKNFKLNITPFYINIENMIRWLPNSGGIWSPSNINNVESYGLESQLDFVKDFGKNNAKFSLGYIYTNSKNVETNRFLSYVPQHKIFGNASYRYDFIEIFAQGMFNGLTFTSEDEKLSSALKSYFVMNAGLHIKILKHYQIGFKANNLFDQIYETTAYFPLPKRNYAANLLINF